MKEFAKKLLEIIDEFGKEYAEDGELQKAFDIIKRDLKRRIAELEDSDNKIN